MPLVCLSCADNQPPPLQKSSLHCYAEQESCKRDTKRVIDNPSVGTPLFLISAEVGILQSEAGQDLTLAPFAAIPLFFSIFPRVELQPLPQQKEKEQVDTAKETVLLQDFFSLFILQQTPQLQERGKPSGGKFAQVWISRSCVSPPHPDQESWNRSQAAIKIPRGKEGRQYILVNQCQSMQQNRAL